MPATIQGYRPDPRIRPRTLAELHRRYDAVIHAQQGAIVFVAGEPGSGRRATLQALREALREDRSHPTVIAGTLAGGAYAPVAMAQKDYDQAMDVLGNLLAIPALFVDPVFGPIVGLLAQLLQLGAVSRPFIQHLASSHAQSPDLSVLALKRSLREAAGQHPVVCLLEHIDAAEARFLNSLFLTSAGELVENRPLLIVASLDGPAELGGHEPDEPNALYVARSLVSRGLAHWLPLAPLTPAEIAAWLGDVEPRLVTHLARVTAGNPTWLALLWDDLWTREKVQRDPVNDRWRLQPGHALATIGTVQDIVGERLQALLDSDEPAEFEDTLYLLAVAALEGRTFTVAALARTLGNDEEEIAEFLDEVLLRSAEQPYGILEEAGHVTIPGIDEERWLWRYRFVSELFWYTLARYPSFTPEQRAELCRELAGSLEQVYASEVRQVARGLARLFAEGGDAGRAEHYHTMATNVGTAAGWYAEAQLLMAASREGWGPEDYTRAAVTLNKAAREMRHAYPYRETLAIAEAAYDTARVAGSRCEEARALTIMGRAVHLLGNPQKALALFEQALPITREVHDRTDEAMILDNMSRVYYDIGQLAQALELLQQALPIMREVCDRAGEAMILNSMAIIYTTTKQLTQALDLFKQVLPIMREMKDRANEATTLNNMATVYNATGQLAQALELYEEALPIIREGGNRANEAATLNNMGLVYQAMGQSAHAIELFEKALPIIREVGNRATEATLLNNMGLAYQVIGQLARALELFKLALPIRSEVGDRAKEATILNSIGMVYQAMGQPARALELYEQALPIIREVGNRADEAMTITNIAAAYQTTEQLALALELLEQMLPIVREVGNQANEATILNNMGSVYFDLGDKPRALELYEQALSLLRQVGDKAGVATTLNNIGGVYSDLGEQPQALAYFEQALPLNRQVGNRWGESITRYNIAMVYKSLDRFEEAEAQLLEVVALDKATAHSNLARDQAALAKVRATRRAQAPDS